MVIKEGSADGEDDFGMAHASIDGKSVSGGVDHKTVSELEMMSKAKGVLVGALLTTAMGAALWAWAPQSWMFTDYRVFNHEDNKEVSRLYRPGPDKVMVKSTPSGDYQTLDKYLSGIKDKADRKLEEAKIKKLVDWYDTPTLNERWQDRNK